jgi:hypothetical protein
MSFSEIQKVLKAVQVCRSRWYEFISVIIILLLCSVVSFSVYNIINEESMSYVRLYILLQG